MRISRLLEVRSAFICETDLTTKHFDGLFRRHAYLFAAIGAYEAFELVIFVCLLSLLLLAY